MAKALVVFSTRTDQTKKIAELVAEGMRFEGLDAKVADASNFDKSGINLEEYDVLAFGAPTYHGEMLQSMKTFLFFAEKANLAGKAGGSFGAYGWSGEAAQRIYDTMKNIFAMKMVDGPLMLKSASLGGGIKMAQDYGRELARKLRE
jgi:flavorubredoxin